MQNKYEENLKLNDLNAKKDMKAAFGQPDDAQFSESFRFQEETSSDQLYEPRMFSLKQIRDLFFIHLNRSKAKE